MVPDFDGAFRIAGCLIIIFVPLGMWKLIEIIIWLWAHVHFGAAP